MNFGLLPEGDDQDYTRELALKLNENDTHLEAKRKMIKPQFHVQRFGCSSDPEDPQMQEFLSYARFVTYNDDDITHLETWAKKCSG